jgi:tape measure domain-containing protein
LRAILRTQGNSQDFDKINKAVQKSVDNTPFSLDQAFGTAVQAIGAGSQDIERFMKNVSDAAGFAGTDMERMGLIFNQVLAKGKLTGEETMQLMEAGVPAQSWIQDSYKLTADQFEDMSKKGAISLDMLQKSIEDHAPGMAKALGNTLQGSIDNMQTSLAKVGANFLSAIFGGAAGDDTEGMKESIQRITEYLKQLGAWINNHRDDIKNFFNDAKDAAANVVTAIGKIIQGIDSIPGGITTVVTAFLAWKAIAGVAALSTALTSISTLLAVTLPASAATGASLISAALAGIVIPAALIAVGGLIGGASLQDAVDANGANSEAGQNALNGIFAPGMGVPGMTRDPIFGVPSTGQTEGDRQRQRRGVSGVLGGGGSFDSSFVPGTAGRGYFNSGAASRYLDDQALLSNVPAGKYSQQGSADLTKGLADCSSSIEDLINIIDGQSTAGRSLTTMNASQLLPARGFMPGTMPGAFNIGFNNSHMQATLPGGTPFNWGSNAAAAQRGIGGSGAFDPAFTSHYYRYASGGGVRGAGSGTSDSIPAMLSHGEHVFSANDVQKMGGQGSVYNFRNALHRAGGGAITGKSLEDMRTAGAIPAAAGSTAEAGTSAISSAIDMGGEVINGIIDQAASAVSSAASAAAMAGSFGAAGPEGGQAAGAAAQFAIGLGTNAAKRGVTYGFDMLGIGADSLLQQLTPFGQPRWLNQDYSGFMPQQAITGALGNLMSGGAQQAAGSGALLDPKIKEHGTGMGGPPGPIDDLMGSVGTQSPSPMVSDANSFLSTQPLAAEAPAPNQPPMFKVDNIYTQDVDSLGRELNKQGRLAQMQYTNRPGP